MSCMQLGVSEGGVAPSVPCNIRELGHSIVAGGGATRVGVTDYPSRLQHLLDPTIYTFSFIGHPSQHVAQWFANVATEVDAYIVPGDFNVFILHDVINSTTWYCALLSAGWQANNVYSVRDATVPTIANGFYYRVTSVSGTGTSSGTQPTWPTTIGATVIDNPGPNQVVWTCTGAFTTVGQIAGQLGLGDHLDMAQGRKTAGYQKAIAVTMYAPYGFSSDNLTCLGIINNGLIAAVGGGIIDGVARLDNDARFVPAGPPGVSKTVVDNTHPTDFGHLIIKDTAIAAIYAQYATVGPAHQWDVLDIGQAIWAYEAKPAGVTFNSTTNKISNVTDRSSWEYDASATGSVQPTWNPRNASFGNQPTIDASGANCLTTALNVDLSFYETIEIVQLFICSNAGAIVVEFSENAASYHDTFYLLHDSNAAGPEVTTFGNVGNSTARAATPAVAVKAVSYQMDNTISTGQCNLLNEGAAIGGEFQSDAPNTNYFGIHQLNLLARNGGSGGATMSLAASYAFSKKLSSSDRTKLLAYLETNWPH